MKNNRNRLSKRIYKIIWSGILLVSLYLLFRFAQLSFDDNFGQADSRITQRMMTAICYKAAENGAAFISYSSRNERNAFPFTLVAAGLALQDYTKDASAQSAQLPIYPGVIEDFGTSSPGQAIEAMNSKNVMNEADIYDISETCLSEEYILTNGAVFDSRMASKLSTGNSSDLLQVGYEKGNVEQVDESTEIDSEEASNAPAITKFTKEQLKDINFLVRTFYIVDKSTKITDDVFNAKKLINTDMTMKQDNDKPQILIYHTHSQEAYADSRAGYPEDTVVGVGTRLTDILENDYGYQVIHDTTTYDIVDGKLNRSVAYTVAEEGITKTLKENPSIEVVIDLHRDGGKARNITIDGKETARVMLFNGLSRDLKGPIEYLENPNLQDNLAFSLQLQLKSYELYPGLFTKNYLKFLRYNMHVRPKCLLVELGTDENTLESAMNAMPPFAKVLDAVLQGK